MNHFFPFHNNGWTPAYCWHSVNHSWSNISDYLSLSGILICMSKLSDDGGRGGHHYSLDLFDDNRWFLDHYSSLRLMLMTVLFVFLLMTFAWPFALLLQCALLSTELMVRIVPILYEVQLGDMFEGCVVPNLLLWLASPALDRIRVSFVDGGHFFITKAAFGAGGGALERISGGVEIFDGFFG